MADHARHGTTVSGGLFDDGSWRCSCGARGTGYVRWHYADAAVRAAAPVLRAGALREAADDLAALAGKWNGTPDFAKALRYAATRIRSRERADRIGGAT